ncbi:MAG: bifunctional adenosylcobinamide kinase/adenosylcobinamide-phosphate guanylyltransferase [Clostridiales bacterium]|nr:bifunctional adenosylcobinamide kinase/adenosylcobinamide-phosphate guanylyltransferase [Clostridiales bacterium]
MIFIFGGAGQGQEAYAKEQYGEKLLFDFHLKVREWMKQGKDPMEETKSILKEQPDVVIVSTEIGCGVVPVDSFEREYREETGRACCYLASQAKKVIRVLCGIGMVIKE